MRKQLLTVTLSAAALFATQAWANQQSGQADAGPGAQQSASAAQSGQQQSAMQSQQKQQVPMRASQDAIRAIQTALKDKGAFEGEADGRWGPETQAALREFQQQQGLDASGNLNFSTIAALDLDMERFGQQSPQTASAGESGQQSGVQEQQAISAPDQSVTMQMSGASVLEIQKALQQQGHYKGELDGLWGPRTAQALREFQQQQGVEGEGLTFDTLAALDLDLQQLAEAESRTGGQADQQSAGASKDQSASGTTGSAQQETVRERQSVTTTTAPPAAGTVIEQEARTGDAFPQQGLDNPSGIAGQQDLRSEGQNPGVGNRPGELDPVEATPGVTGNPPQPYIRQ